MLPFIGAVAVVGVVGIIAHEDHHNYSDHRDYSDAADRQARQKEAKRKARDKEKMESIKDVDKALHNIYDQIREMAREEGIPENILQSLQEKTSKDFSFTNYQQEFGELQNDIRDKISKIVEVKFADEIATKTKELNAINDMIRRVNEISLSVKKSKDTTENHQ